MGLVVKPTVVNNVIYRRATFRERIRWRRGPSKEAAQPVDLTEADARAYILSSYDAFDAPLHTLRVGAGLTLEGAQGTTVLEIEATDTAGLPLCPAAVRVLEIVWPDGDVCRLIMGACPIEA